MKHRFLLFKNKWQVPFHLGSAFLPACLLVGAYAIPDNPYIACLPALIYLIGVYVCMLLTDSQAIRDVLLFPTMKSLDK